MKVYLGIGTNLGDREKNLTEALKLIKEHIGRIRQVSSVYETEPWGFESENDFLNMAAEVETKLKPSGLLGRILMIEANMGRLRDEKKYSSRLIDIDILLFADKILEAKSLEIPHPRLHERKFVLVPLNEIAGDFLHPKLGKTIKALLKECPDKSRVRKSGRKS
jgi:2-amino-4-hydroxy-6-hydroxymethyldihydropteridine diphosphokinase